MNSELAQRLKIILIISGFLLSAFIFYVWLIGPIQGFAAENKLFLEKLYDNTVFDNCELITNTQIDSESHLAQCQVNESHMVYLNMDDDAKILDRHNFLLDQYVESIDLIKRLYQVDMVQFSYYNNQFVFNIKTVDEELFLDITNLEKVFSVKK